RLPRPRRRERGSAHEPDATRRGRGLARDPPPARFPEVRRPRRRAGRLALELARAGTAPRPADAAPRLDVLAVRRPPLRYLGDPSLRPRWRRLVRRLREGAPPRAARAAARARARGGERLHDRDARPGGPGPRGVRRRRLRAVRRLRGATVVRRADREPVRALLARVRSDARARRL